MTETLAPVPKPVPRPRSKKSATVSASALALHLDLSRAYIGKLEADGVLHRAPDRRGFDVDASRETYYGSCAASIATRRARKPTLITSSSRPR